MNHDALLDYIKGAAHVVSSYEKRMQLISAQIDASKDASEEDKEILNNWVVNNSKYLADHSEAYNKAKAMQSYLKDQRSFEEIETLYRVLFPDERTITDGVGETT